MTAVNQGLGAVLRTALVWLTTVVGCNPPAQPASVKVQGEPIHTRQLAGRWEGEFLNDDTGRIGRIFLDLQADSDSVRQGTCWAARAD
jgi:hypothetical protein